jgi:hypothetical protein
MNDFSINVEILFWRDCWQHRSSQELSQEMIKRENSFFFASIYHRELIKYCAEQRPELSDLARRLQRTESMR